MVMLVAIASPRAGSLKLPEIPESKLDAQLLYETLARAIDKTFDHTQSICLIDPARADVSSLLSIVSSHASRSDTLVIFYSGHGTLKGARLFLNFADAAENGRGRVSVAELGEWLSSCEAEIVLILDCCSSGVGLDLANRVDPFEDVHISVLASAESHARSTFTGSGSEFTSALCQTISVMSEQKVPYSLVTITNLLKQDRGQKCTLNVRQGIEDLVIPSQSDDTALPKSFGSDFVRAVHGLPLSVREMLWYSLIDVKLDRRLDVLQHYFSEAQYGEPSWLVRRAIGTAVDSCRTATHSFYELMRELLGSSNWMKCAIGLLGSKESLDDPALREGVKAALHSEKMDLTWVAHLYLTDAGAISIEEALGTKLAKTEWGIADIASRWLGAGSKQEYNLGKIIEHCSGEVARQALGTHCHGLRVSSPLVSKLPYDRQVSEAPLVSFLYESKRRSRTLQPRLKWMLSSLYGTWRDQLQSDIGEWLDGHPVQDGSSQLSICSRVPAVEVRMAVFQFLVNRSKLIDTYRESLLWGLADPHPWVRRVAVSALRADPNARSALANTFNMSLYPGVLDLHLESFRYGLSCQETLDRQSFTAIERESISWALRNESEHSA